MLDVEGVTAVPDVPKPDYDEDIKSLVAAADEARSKYNELDSGKRTKETEKDTLSKQVTADVGDRQQFGSMVGQCYELIDREYK